MQNKVFIPIFTSLLAFALGCYEEKPAENVSVYSKCYDAVYHRIMPDGVSILVIERSKKDFDFYKDFNLDGWADTRGRGYYERGVPKGLNEAPITPFKLRMDRLQAEAPYCV